MTKKESGRTSASDLLSPNFTVSALTGRHKPLRGPLSRDRRLLARLLFLQRNKSENWRDRWFISATAPPATGYGTRRRRAGMPGRASPRSWLTAFSSSSPSASWSAMRSHTGPGANRLARAFGEVDALDDAALRLLASIEPGTPPSEV